jgi:hypothetical protein
MIFKNNINSLTVKGNLDFLNNNQIKLNFKQIIIANLLIKDMSYFVNI